MRRDRIRIPAALLLVWLATLVAVVGMPGHAMAQAKEYHMDRFDTDITVNTDGSMDIVETLTFVFTSGTFRRGLRTWELNKLEGITVTSVAENRNSTLRYYTEEAFDPDNSTAGVPGTYGIENDGKELRVRWIFGTTANATRTFLISYHVNGAIRVYANVNTLAWYAVPPRWESPIDQTRVSATFPTGIVTNNWVVASYPLAGVSKEDNIIVWSANSGLENGFEVAVDIPRYALSFNKPSWQDSFDQQYAGQSDINNNTNRTGIFGDTNVFKSLIDFGGFVSSMVSLFESILRRLVIWYVGGV
jgi:hypothetical protein